MASDAEDATPILIPRNEAKSRPRASRATAAAARRFLTTPFAHALHARLARFSWRIFGQSTRGPMPPRMAGVSVSVVNTLASGISAPPRPMLRMNGTGRTTRARSPMATVTPLNTTARPAVSMAVTTASWLSRPWSRSSRQRVTNSRE